MTAVRTLDIAGFRVGRMYHPSHHVLSLDEAEAWYERVLGRESLPMALMNQGRPPTPGYPQDYSTFTPIADLLLDTIDPKRYVTGGIQRYPTVETPHLKGFGWYVPDMQACYTAINDLGIGTVGQNDDPGGGPEVPRSANGTLPLFFTTPETAGLRYEFLPTIPFPLDPRIKEGWELPPASGDPVLGIDHTSHHTVLTGDLDRALKVVVTALGGRVIHEGRNELLGLTSTYVQLSDSILEYGTPDEGTDAWADWQTTRPHDTYHTITFRVADLGKVAAHLDAQGVAFRTRTDEAIVADPRTALGIPWIFTTAPVPGDPRG
ncbi:hypothetical protein Amsp01_049660 [Amycolatopsis sp. NBRC 101858]|uniref:VOC family protein n=1 Tax=Amycolatopsis sp. NBRC 101858 TaxID=3032200 RepID=UPI00249FBD31|nr:VOC family protein [Amycolatopsis sp. NBRC 101858]GLY38942.1 hypothetical protein Amsp01_049660 [Amycolatopsis sp. NBRC 101858]